MRDWLTKPTTIPRWRILGLNLLVTLFALAIVTQNGGWKHLWPMPWEIAALFTGIVVAILVSYLRYRQTRKPQQD